MAFEVDEFDLAAREGWSVLLHGPAHHLDSGAERPDAQAAGVEPWPERGRVTTQAMVQIGPDLRALTEVPDPEITPDTIVRIDATTICGTDLQILAGDVPGIRSGPSIRRALPRDWLAHRAAFGR